MHMNKGRISFYTNFLFVVYVVRIKIDMEYNRLAQNFGFFNPTILQSSHIAIIASTIIASTIHNPYLIAYRNNHNNRNLSYPSPSTIPHI